MNLAEGFRRIFQVFGVVAALLTIAIGIGDRPSSERVTSSTKYELLSILGENAATSEGRSQPWYAYQIQDAWYKGWSDAAIVETWCGKEARPANARIKQKCDEHRKRLNSLWRDIAWHFLLMLGGAALAYQASLWLCSLLVWIGRGFMQPVGGPRPK